MTKAKREKIKTIVQRGDTYYFKDKSELYKRDYESPLYSPEYVLRAADGNTIDVDVSLDRILDYLTED